MNRVSEKCVLCYLKAIQCESVYARKVLLLPLCLLLAYIVSPVYF